MRRTLGGTASYRHRTGLVRPGPSTAWCHVKTMQHLKEKQKHQDNNRIHDVQAAPNQKETQCTKISASEATIQLFQQENRKKPLMQYTFN